MRTAYSYLRYSRPSQGAGDSVRRQDAGPLEWCRRNGARLDLSKRMDDKGLSAADGANLDIGALAGFLADVEAGEIEPGSVLIVDNLDRFSRADPWAAMSKLTRVVDAGISVVALSPRETTFERGSDLGALFTAVVEFGRSNGESVTKSVNLRSAWGNKKRAARETGAPMLSKDHRGSHHPKWLEVLDGKFVPVPDRVAAVRRLFALAVAGCGVKLICRTLEAEGFAAFGYRGRWNRSAVYSILKGRAVLGEYQPHKLTARKPGNKRKSRAPDGEPIAGYYPAVVDETTWHRAQGSLSDRYVGGRPVGGRVAAVPDLFTGLIRDAGQGCKMLVTSQTRGKPGSRVKARVLAPADGFDGRCKVAMFPYRVFEAEVLDRLREVTAAEVLGAEPEGESGAIAGELARKTARAKALQTELTADGEDAEVPELAEALRKVNAERVALKRKLAEARAREANPRAEAFAEMQTLADVAANPETRLRLRTVLRLVVESVDVVIVRRGVRWLAAVQLSFAGGGWRSYWLEYRPAGNGRAEVADSEAFQHDGARLDLRRKADVAKMRRFLETMHDGYAAGAARPAA
jgi:hypothetical protein